MRRLFLYGIIALSALSANGQTLDNLRAVNIRITELEDSVSYFRQLAVKNAAEIDRAKKELDRAKSDRKRSIALGERFQDHIRSVDSMQYDLTHDSATIISFLIRTVPFDLEQLKNTEVWVPPGVQITVNKTPSLAGEIIGNRKGVQREVSKGETLIFIQEDTDVYRSLRDNDVYVLQKQGRKRETYSVLRSDIDKTMFLDFMAGIYGIYNDKDQRSKYLGPTLDSLQREKELLEGIYESVSADGSPLMDKLMKELTDKTILDSVYTENSRRYDTK